MPTTLPTVGEIARRRNVPIHAVEYVIKTRGILPAGRAGNVRVFSEDDVLLIASELEAIAEALHPELFD